MFYDVYDIVDKLYPDIVFFLFQGGRGKGKTYSALKGALERCNEDNKIFYIRRTDTQIKACCKEYSNPFKVLNKDLNRDIYMKTTDDMSLIFENIDDEKKILGYGGSLSTFGNMRGADFSDVSILFFDEWINLSPVNSLKDEAYLLFNLYETIARNREMLGGKPPLLIMCSNAESINDNIIRTLKLGKVIMEIASSNTGYGSYTDKERRLYYEKLENSGEFEKKKKETALYQLTKGTRFYDMSIDNAFTRDYFGDIKRYQYHEFNPLCSYEKIYFYVHKTQGFVYASYRKAKCPKYYERTLKHFKRDYGFLMMNQIEGGLMKYMDYNVKIDVMNIF